MAHRRAGLAALAAALFVGLALGAGAPAGLGTARAAEPLDAGPDPSPAGAAATAASTVRSPRVVWHGPRSERTVALTVDDGWNPATLRAIYRILVRENVPATFFVTGVYVQRDPDLWRVVASRFPLANHSYLHRDTRRLTDRQVGADLARTRTVVERATGRRMLPYFRPPYGSRTPTTDRLAAEAGFPTIVMWDVTAADTVRRPTVAGVVRAATAGRPGSIVLLHAGPQVTPRALPAIIASYRARGFRFVTVPELLGDPAWVAEPFTARSLDRVADGPAVVSPGGAAQVPAGGDLEPVVTPAAPGAPAPGDAAAAPARDAAWARSDGTPGALAAWTVALLVAVIALAAVAGRTGRREDEPGA